MPSSPVFDSFLQDVFIKSNPGGHWRVKRFKASRTGTVTWRCDVEGCYIWLMFPFQRSPLAGGSVQVHGASPLSVTLAVGIDALGTYPYCVLIQDACNEFHLVEGNSPPEIEIQ